MCTSRSPLTASTSSPHWYGWTDNRPKQAALQNTTDAEQPLTESPTPRSNHSVCSYFTATEQNRPVSSQTMSSAGSSKSQGTYSREEPTFENTVQTTRHLTENLMFIKDPKLGTRRSLSAQFTTAEMRTTVALPTMNSSAFSEGVGVYPTRELQIPRSGICAPMGLFLIAVLPLLVIPAFCVVAFVGLWIPRNGGEHADALHQPTVLSVSATHFSMPGETTTMRPTSGLVESTTVVDDPAISIYPGGIGLKGGISP